MLKAEGKDSELNEFMIECKQYKREDDIYKYSLYVHGWLIPYLDKMRKEGRLTKVKKEWRCRLGFPWVYEGEADEMGRKCGEGVAR